MHRVPEELGSLRPGADGSQGAGGPFRLGCCLTLGLRSSFPPGQLGAQTDQLLAALRGACLQHPEAGLLTFEELLKLLSGAADSYFSFSLSRIAAAFTNALFCTARASTSCSSPISSRCCANSSSAAASCCACCVALSSASL